MNREGFILNDITEIRAIQLAQYIISTNGTVRSAAKRFGISKSTVHVDVTKRLKNSNPTLYNQVRKIIELNKAERHLRGGLATKQKYSK